MNTLDSRSLQSLAVVSALSPAIRGAGVDVHERMGLQKKQGAARVRREVFDTLAHKTLPPSTPLPGSTCNPNAWVGERLLKEPLASSPSRRGSKQKSRHRQESWAGFG